MHADSNCGRGTCFFSENTDLISGHFYGKIFNKTVRGPCQNNVPDYSLGELAVSSRPRSPSFPRMSLPSFYPHRRTPYCHPYK